MSGMSGMSDEPTPKAPSRGDAPVLAATDITSALDLSLPGAPVVRDQARFGLDLDYLMAARTTLSFTVHAAGRGESPDVSGAVSLRRAF